MRRSEGWVPRREASFAGPRIGSYNAPRPGATICGIGVFPCREIPQFPIGEPAVTPRLRHPVTCCTILAIRARRRRRPLQVQCHDTTSSCATPRARFFLLSPALLLALLLSCSPVLLLCPPSAMAIACIVTCILVGRYTTVVRVRLTFVSVTPH
ncbi:hypothetical protein F4859DRAFT_436590 [Xylaria cf. heliscus]|nr:hypothetical protein F4859DRAFT_436590 [Xylaria cf. heliscus]